MCDLRYVHTMTFHPTHQTDDLDFGGHVVLLVKESNQSTAAVTSLMVVPVTSLGIPKSHDSCQPIRIHRRCHCAVLVQEDKKYVQLF